MLTWLLENGKADALAVVRATPEGALGLSYADLGAAVAAVAAMLVEGGGSLANRVVLIAVEDSVAAAVAALAALEVGAVPLVADARAPAAWRAELLAESGAALVVHDDASGERLLLAGGVAQPRLVGPEAALLVQHGAQLVVLGGRQLQRHLAALVEAGTALWPRAGGTHAVLGAAHLPAVLVGELWGSWRAGGTVAALDGVLARRGPAALLGELATLGAAGLVAPPRALAALATAASALSQRPRLAYLGSTAPLSPAAQARLVEALAPATFFVEERSALAAGVIARTIAGVSTPLPGVTLAEDGSWRAPWLALGAWDGGAAPACTRLDAVSARLGEAVDFADAARRLAAAAMTELALLPTRTPDGEVRIACFAAEPAQRSRLEAAAQAVLRPIERPHKLVVLAQLPRDASGAILHEPLRRMLEIG